MSERPSISVEQLVPGGILPTDAWHYRMDDGTCSRCGRMPPEHDVPLLVWSEDGHSMLRFCQECLGEGE